MPSPPVSEEDARLITMRIGGVPPEYLAAINELRGDLSVGGWVWEAILNKLKRETGYEEPRRAAPRRWHGDNPGNINAYVSSRALETIEANPDGLTPRQWIRAAIEEELMAELGSLPGVAPRPGQPPRERDETAIAIARGAYEALTAAGTPGSEAVRLLYERGILAPLSLREVAGISGLSPQGVSDIKNKQRKEG
jgi:hypothetical protein